MILLLLQRLQSDTGQHNHTLKSQAHDGQQVKNACLDSCRTMPFLFWGSATNNPEKAPLSVIRRGSQDPWAPNRPTPLPLLGTFSHGSTRLPAQKLPAVASPSTELDALRVDNSRFPSLRLATLFAVATCRYLLRFAFLYLISFFLPLIATIHSLRLLLPPTSSPPGPQHCPLVFRDSVLPAATLDSSHHRGQSHRRSRRPPTGAASTEHHNSPVPTNREVSHG